MAWRLDVPHDKLLAEWFWCDRWMGSSAFLLPLEPRGLYREMLTAAWRRGAKLPNDHEAIRRAVGCTVEEWERNWPKIAHYWDASPDGNILTNETQLDVFHKAAHLRELRAKAGAKGGRRVSKPQANEEAKGQAKGQAKSKPLSPSLSPSLSETPNDEESAASRPQSGNGVALVWEAFASRHPKAVLTPDRRKTIAARLRAGYTVEQLLTAIEGLHLSEWHARTGNLTIEYGLRNAQQIEKLIAVAEDPNHPGRVKSGPVLSEKSRQALQAGESFLRRHADEG